MRIDLDLYFHKVEDKFLGRGILVSVNEVSGCIGRLRSQEIAHSCSVGALVSGRVMVALSADRQTVLRHLKLTLIGK